MKPNLIIKNLRVSIEEKEILKGVDLTVRGGEIHAIMGPNGTGKSTLASAIMGNPNYNVTDGAIELDDANILEMEVDERARSGIFLGMQYPSEIAGVTNADFLRTAINTNKESDEELSLFKFAKKLDMSAKKLEMRQDLPHRYLNVGFSGGEKKRNEILQMLMLDPKIAILDEIDSGLDIDALRIVGSNITNMVQERGDQVGVLLITHYQRLLDYVKPDFVHVFMNGKIVKTGSYELALKLEAEGYDWLKDELGIESNEDIQQTIEQVSRKSLGSCAVPKNEVK